MSEQDLNSTIRMDAFYKRLFYLSYSSLSRILYSPSLFYKEYILLDKEEKLQSHLVDGKVIHCLLLDDGSFDKDFMIMPTTLPGDSLRNVIDQVFNNPDIVNNEFLRDHEQDILDVLASINLHQSLKTDAQRLDKIFTLEGINYWGFLMIKKDKILLDAPTMYRCNEAVAALRAHPKVAELLGLLTTEMDNVEIFNEKYLQIEKSHTGKSFGMKGIVDNYKIDHDKKIIFINDLKTTGKSITDFPNAIEYYNYWAQAAMYFNLIYTLHQDLIKKEYTIQFTFIVIDKYNQIYPFSVSTDTMTEWLTKLGEKLNEVEWHYVNKEYKLPYIFATGKVIL